MYKQEVSLHECEPALLFWSVPTLTFAVLTRLAMPGIKSNCCGDGWQLAMSSFKLPKKKKTYFQK